MRKRGASAFKQPGGKIGSGETPDAALARERMGASLTPNRHLSRSWGRSARKPVHAGVYLVGRGSCTSIPPPKSKKRNGLRRSTPVWNSPRSPRITSFRIAGRSSGRVEARRSALLQPMSGCYLHPSRHPHPRCTLPLAA
ncbi:hypothetical protein [Sinorhizobium fredii]|uniref:hypothetical protein n=1 Tax=Rhizobium fredii TaxID=380 RepID=UPI0030B677FE